MRPLLVCGTANAEMVLRLKGEILPTAEGVFSNVLGLNVSGVGVNLARGLERLGSPVRLLTLTADDPAGALVRASLGGIQTRFALTRAIPQTLALVHLGGTHTFYCGLGDKPQAYAPAAECLELLPICVAQRGLDARTPTPGTAFRHPEFRHPNSDGTRHGRCASSTRLSCSARLPGGAWEALRQPSNCAAAAQATR